jgi:hypothetical protein
MFDYLLVGPHAKNESHLITLIRPESSQLEPPLSSQVLALLPLAHRSSQPVIPQSTAVPHATTIPHVACHSSCHRHFSCHVARPCFLTTPPLDGRVGAWLALGRVSSQIQHWDCSSHAPVPPMRHPQLAEWIKLKMDSPGHGMDHSEVPQGYDIDFFLM